MEFLRTQHGKGFSNPGVRVERADFSATDYTFDVMPRFITCSEGGLLVIDLPDAAEDETQEEVAVQVFAGYNPIRPKKIYNSGSTAMTVDGWS